MSQYERDRDFILYLIQDNKIIRRKAIRLCAHEAGITNYATLRALKELERQGLIERIEYPTNWWYEGISYAIVEE